MGFLTDLKISRLWARSLAAFDSRDAGEAVRLIEEMARFRPLKAFEIARLATNYTRLEQSDVARPLFEEAAAKTADALAGQKKYVNEYCQLFLMAMDSDEDLEPHRDRISQMKCSPAIKRWLPVR
jgi:hypothetical protein